MEERTDHVTVYVAHHVASQHLNNKQYRTFWEGYFDYAFYGIVPDFGQDKQLVTVWEVVRGTIDRGIAQQLGGKKGGKNSGEARKPNKTDTSFEATLEPTFKGRFEQYKDKEKEKYKYKEKEKGTRAQFAALTITCRECGGTVEKSKSSPNFVCTRCHTIYKPDEFYRLHKSINAM